MAGNTIDINLNVQDQNRTLQTRTNDARRLNEQLERAQNLSRGTGTRTGNQAMRQAAFGGEVSEYNIAGGASQRAGGTARDFADQARGLGGLVRLYAEYAANLFAVSAAFTALRNAMDTQIMIRGMEQLSAATGDSLASMSKSFISATDGMISFREAAEAVTKATTSGLGREQVMQIAEVAKGASQALGLNMTDAVSRLTRGITKLEPELLDELGIFTKLDKAVQDYARTVGKSESQLTDFERRQAFANAVLAEGRSKFSEIAQEGNPYDKLLASLKDTGTQILNIINSIVAPIAKIFADNQVLIVGAITVIASKLITKAIPALNDYGEWLKKTAKESAEVASGMSSDAWHGQYTRLANKAGMETSQKRVMDLANQNLSLEKQIDDVKKKQANTIQEIIKRDNQVVVLQAKILANQREITAERKKQDTIAEQTVDRMSQEPTLLKDTWGFMKAKIADMENSRARGLDIRSQVVDVAQEQGPLAAFEKLNELLTASSSAMGFFARATTRVAGIIAILGTAIRTVATFLAPFLRIIGGVIAAYEILAPYIHGNTKEIEAFKGKLDQLNDTVKTAEDVNKKYKQSLSTESLLAYANSFDSVTKSMRESVTAFNEANAAANPFDKMLQSIKDLLPFMDSLQEKAAESIGKAVQAQITTLGDRPEGEKYKQDIASVLGIDPKKPINAKSVTDALDSIFVSADKFAERQDAITKLTEQANKKFQEQTLYLKGLSQESRNAEKSAAEFMNSLKDTSKITQFQENNLKYIVQLNQALQSTDFRSQVAAIDSLKGSNFGALFGEASVQIARLSEEFENIQGPLDAASVELVKVNKRIEELGDGPLWFWQAQELEGLKALQKGLQDVVNVGKEKAKELTELVSRAVANSVAEQAAKTIEKFKLEFEKLGIEQAKFIASKSPVKTLEGIKYQANLDKKAIDVETKLITAQYDLAESIDRLNFTIKLESDMRLANELKQKGVVADYTPGATGEGAQLAKLENRINPDLMVRAEQLVTSNAAKLGMTDKAFQDEIQKYLQIFPELAGRFNRSLTKELKVKGAEYKKEQIGIQQALDSINLTSQRAIETLDNEIQAINTALTNIGSDTPERIQIQLDAASAIFERETAKINTATQAKLDQLDVLAKSSAPPADLAQQRARVVDEKEIALQKLSQTNSEKTLQNETQKTYLINKRRLDITIATLEAQKNLIIGEGLVAEKSRQSLDRQIEAAKNAEGLLDLEKQRATSQAKLAQFMDKYKGSEGLTVAQEIEKKRLQEAVLADEAAISNRRNLNTLVGRGNELQREQVILSLEQGVNMANMENRLNRELSAFEKLTTFREYNLEIADKDLELADKMGLLTDRQLQIAKAESAINKINLDFSRESFRLEQDRLKLQQQLKDLEAKNPQARVREVLDEVSGTTYMQDDRTEGMIRLQGQIEGINSQLDALGIRTANRLNMVARELDITPRLEKYSASFKSMFDSMADAIVEFAQTGKANFKDLVNNLIADIARYELKLMTTEAWAASRPFIMQFLSNAFGFLGMPGAFGSTGGGGYSYYGEAKGGAYDAGQRFTLPGYAKGGMFTNSIVNSPTLFRAAKGIGVMGEAGPEAIMPLKRDSNGNLGVRSNQGNVEVVVNNYSSEKATAKETTDARGNRRVEVQIGDIVANQMTTNNSSVQQAMMGSFGSKPRMVRR